MSATSTRVAEHGAPAPADGATAPADGAAASADGAQFLAACDARAAAGWAEIHRGAFWRELRRSGLDRETYVDLLTQIFHYTRHNAQNQALAALHVDSDRLPLLRFCLRHALEEAGHDLMVLHDLAHFRVGAEEVRRSAPLPETEAFVAWLERTARDEDATARLGYSYWAESCYGHIAELTEAMRRDLELGSAQMTFFAAHSAIDREHFDEVRRIAVEFCDTPHKRARLLHVLETSLALTGSILQGVQRRREARSAR
jgi:thiaminase